MSTQRTSFLHHEVDLSAHRSLAKIGQLVPLEAKPDQSTALREFLLTGYSLLAGDQEPETLQWYAVKYDTPTPVYAIIDSFAAESGRQAHINGKVAEALIANSDKLLARGPDIPAGAFDILASKLQSAGSQADVKKGLSCGLRVLIKAKPDQVETVREFLKVSMSLLVSSEHHFELHCRVRFLWSKRNLRHPCGTPSSSRELLYSGSSTSSPPKQVWMRI